MIRLTITRTKGGKWESREYWSDSMDGLKAIEKTTVNDFEALWECEGRLAKTKDRLSVLSESPNSRILVSSDGECVSFITESLEGANRRGTPAIKFMVSKMEYEKQSQPGWSRPMYTTASRATDYIFVDTYEAAENAVNRFASGLESMGFSKADPYPNAKMTKLCRTKTETAEGQANASEIVQFEVFAFACWEHVEKGGFKNEKAYRL